MTFRNLTAKRLWLILALVVGLAYTTLPASGPAFADEWGKEVGGPEGHGGGSDLELVNPGDDDQPTIKKRRQRDIEQGMPEGDTAQAPDRLRADGAERRRVLPAGIWVRVSFDLWLGMLR
jgi:hypothetical protein